MKWVNTKTGAVVETGCTLGGDWKKKIEVVEYTDDSEEKPVEKKDKKAKKR